MLWESERSTSRISDRGRIYSWINDCDLGKAIIFAQNIDVGARKGVTRECGSFCLYLPN
jgi:hypothetical protein